MDREEQIRNRGYELVGIGATSMVSGEDGGKTVLKGYEVWTNGERRAYREESPTAEDVVAHEARAYQHLGPHDHLLRCDGLVEVHQGVHSLRLERAPCGSLRQYIRDTTASPPPMQERLSMAMGVASGLAHLHSKNVLYHDMTCRNLFLFDDSIVKIGDLGAASVDGVQPAHNACEESRYELPLRGRLFMERPSREVEIFALGSAIYEILCWKRPFNEIEDELEIEAKYAAELFPDVSHLPAADIILGCWNERYNSAADVEKALSKLRSEGETAEDGHAGSDTKEYDTRGDAIESTWSLGSLIGWLRRTVWG